MATLKERVAERYPSLMPLLNHPEVGRLLRDAVDPASPMSAGVFRSKLEATRWFRSQPASARQWWVTTRLDPGEARKQRSEYSASLQRVASHLGLHMSSKGIKYMTEVGLTSGFTADSDRMMGELLKRGRKYGNIGPGAYKTAIGQVRARGTGVWLRQPPTKEAEYWGAEIALGRKTLDDFEQASRTTAEKRYPHMVEQLRAGQTVADIIRPGVEAYAREMDWDPEGVMGKMWKNPQFAGLTGVRDPKTKSMHIPTEQEAMVMARKRADWWQTTRGEQADNAMAQRLMETFGIRKA